MSSINNKKAIITSMALVAVFAFVMAPILSNAALALPKSDHGDHGHHPHPCHWVKKCHWDWRHHKWVCHWIKICHH